MTISCWACMASSFTFFHTLPGGASAGFATLFGSS